MSNISFEHNKKHANTPISETPLKRNVFCRQYCLKGTSQIEMFKSKRLSPSCILQWICLWWQGSNHVNVPEGTQVDFIFANGWALDSRGIYDGISCSHERLTREIGKLSRVPGVFFTPQLSECHSHSKLTAALLSNIIIKGMTDTEKWFYFHLLRIGCHVECTFKCYLCNVFTRNRSNFKIWILIL